MEDWGEVLVTHWGSVEKEEQSRFQRVIGFLEKSTEWATNISRINSVFKEAWVLKTLKIVEGDSKYVSLKESTWEIENANGETDENINRKSIKSTADLIRLYREHSLLFEESEDLAELNTEMLKLGKDIERQFLAEKICDWVGWEVQRIIEGLPEDIKAKLDRVLLALSTTNTDLRANFLQCYARHPKEWNDVITEVTSDDDLVAFLSFPNETVAFSRLLGQIDRWTLSKICEQINSSNSVHSFFSFIRWVNVNVKVLAQILQSISDKDLKRLLFSDFLITMSFQHLCGEIKDVENLIKVLSSPNTSDKFYEILTADNGILFRLLLDNIRDINFFMAFLKEIDDIWKLNRLLDRYNFDRIILVVQIMNKSSDPSKIARWVNHWKDILPIRSRILT